MKHFVIGIGMFLLIALNACQRPENRGSAGTLNEPVASLYEPGLKPFYHGVASGDPLPDRVVIWTRVTPEDSVESIAVTWEIADSKDFSTIVKASTASAMASHDYTVKVDVDSLKPGQTYYYRFHALGKTSITGRTRTAPVGSVPNLNFAVVTCSNWEWGFFNAYDRIGDIDSLDGVIHLGDYIYEHATGVYGDTTLGRIHMPAHEVITLADYRTRYSQYRLDPGLRRAHQQHPFIPVWDDHEIANNSFTEGAQNHQPNEGDYQLRKSAARQAYYEWLPIREGATLYRAYSFGDLADVLMLDERLAGKTKPVDSASDPAFNSEMRRMLGPDQSEWLKEHLKSSTRTWKIIGNQVLFSEMNLSAMRPLAPIDFDSWSGYPAERKNIRDFIVSEKIQNVVLVTGDTHAAWAIEVSSGAKSNSPFAVELCTTSISSGNGDESQPAESVRKAEEATLKLNPQVKFYNNRDHGYLLLSLRPSRLKASWYYVETVKKPNNNQFLGKEFVIQNGSPRLR